MESIWSSNEVDFLQNNFLNMNDNESKQRYEKGTGEEPISSNPDESLFKIYNITRVKMTSLDKQLKKEIDDVLRTAENLKKCA